MAVETVKFASENTLKAVVSESKKYSKKVSAVTVTTDTTTDVNATIYKFTQNGEEIASIKVDSDIAGSDMEEITAEEVEDMFKEDVVLNFSDTNIIVEAKGKQLTTSDTVKEGWVLTISAPAANPADATKNLTAIVVNGVSLTSLVDNEDNTRKIGTYTVTSVDEKTGVGITITYSA